MIIRKQTMHEPVLLNEVIKYLHIKSQAWYIDATVGAGGHSKEILKHGGNVLGIDQDPAMLEVAKANIEEFIKACPTPNSLGSYKLINSNFTNIDQVVKKASVSPILGILLDLGVSNYHFKNFDRGFSFANEDAFLDMRLDPSTQQVTAADLVNALREDQLVALFSVSLPRGEALRIARKIIHKRKFEKILTVGDFLHRVIDKVKITRTHPATKPLMALRMAVNNELDNISTVIPKAFELLDRGGKLAIISFHSGEDKLVAHHFSDLVKAGNAQLVTKKPVKPSLEELKRNRKSRSALLRVIEKL